MDDPEYEENIDMNHTPDIIHTGEEEADFEPNINTYNESYKIGDLFILITQEGDDIIEDSFQKILNHVPGKKDQYLQPQCNLNKESEIL